MIPDPLAPSTVELQEAAVRGSAWTSLQATVLLPLTVVVNIVVARTLGPHQFGYVATLMAAYGVVVAVANFGVSDATIQWGAGAYAQGSRDELLALVRRCAGFHLFVETPLIVVATAVLLHSAGWQTQVAACAAAGITMAIGTVSVAQTLLSRTATIAKAALVVTVGVQVAVVTTAIESHSGYKTWAARLVASMALPLVLFFRSSPEVRRAVIKPLIPHAWPSGFTSYALKAFVGGLASLLVFSRSEIFVLEAKHLAVAAGVFALAYGTSAQLTAPIDAVLGPLVPAAASLSAVASDRVAGAVLRGLRVTALATGIIAALAVPAVSILIPVIYGSRFAQAASLLVPLGLISCLQSLNHPVTAFVLGMRRVGGLVLVNLIAFAVDISIALVSVAKLHAWGAVLANAIGQVIALAGAVFLLRRVISLSVRSLADSARAFVLGAVSGVAAWLITKPLDAYIPSLGLAGVAVCVGATLFLLLQVPGKPLLTAADVQLLAGVTPRSFRLRLPRWLSALRIAPAEAGG